MKDKIEFSQLKKELDRNEEKLDLSEEEIAERYKRIRNSWFPLMIDLNLTNDFGVIEGVLLSALLRHRELAEQYDDLTEEGEIFYIAEAITELGITEFQLQKALEKLRKLNVLSARKLKDNIWGFILHNID